LDLKLEISKFIQDALKDGSIEKVSKAIEQLVMMMINAIGMIERRELEFEKRLEVIEEDIDLIKSFLLSKPAPLPKTTTPPIKPPTTPIPPASPSKPITPPQPTRTVPSPSPAIPPSQGGQMTELPPTGPSEEDIIAFRQKLLKPTPKHEKPKAQPLSIRAALMQEMKEYFGSAMTKVKKEKKKSE